MILLIKLVLCVCRNSSLYILEIWKQFLIFNIFLLDINVKVFLEIKKWIFYLQILINVDDFYNLL